MQEPNHKHSVVDGEIVRTIMEIMLLEASHQEAALVTSQKIETKPEASAKRSHQTNTAWKQTVTAATASTTTHPSIPPTTNAKSKKTGII